MAFALLCSKPHTLPTKDAHGTRQANETSSGVEISARMCSDYAARNIHREEGEDDDKGEGDGEGEEIHDVSQQQMIAFNI